MKTEHPLIAARAMIAALATLVLLLSTHTQSISLGQSRQLEQIDAARVKELPAQAKRWALVIGVDQYQDGGITRLNGASKDARTLAAALVQYAGFPDGQVLLLSSDQPVERQPTQRKILRYLSNMRGLVPKDGLLLVAFAGHGVERGGRAFLLPADAESSEDIALLEDTAIGVERMKELIRATGVGQVILILDACRNDPAAGRSGGDNPLTSAFSRSFNFDARNSEVQAFVSLYATAVGQRAYEYAEKQQGYFTWALVEGIKGAAANERGEVTLGRLLSYVQDTVPRYVRRDLGASKQQKPFAMIEGYRAEELVVAVASKPAAPQPSNKSTTLTEDTSAAELAFWDSIKNSNNPEDFKAYLREFPSGRFVSLARNRLPAPEPSNKPAPATSPGVSADAMEYFLSARKLIDNKQFAQAEAAMQKALRLEPNNAIYHATLTASLLRQQKYVEAEASAREAIRLDPNNAEARAGLGFASVLLGKFVEGEASIREAIRLNPNIALYYTYLAISLMRQGKHVEAEAAAREAIRLDANIAEGHAVLGTALAFQGKFAEGEAGLRKATRLEPTNPTYHAFLAMTLIKQQKYAESEVIAREGIRLDPNNADSYAVLGHALAYQKKLPEAEAALREAVRLAPNNTQYRVDLETVKSQIK